MKRKAPVGGEAYGTPKNASIGDKRVFTEPELGLSFKNRPCKVPYLIVTVLGDMNRLPAPHRSVNDVDDDDVDKLLTSDHTQMDNRTKAANTLGTN